MSLTQRSWCSTTTRALPVSRRSVLPSSLNSPVHYRGAKSTRSIGPSGDEGDIRLACQPAGVLDGAIELISNSNIPVTPIPRTVTASEVWPRFEFPVTILKAVTINWPMATGVTLSIQNLWRIVLSMARSALLCGSDSGGARLDFFAG